MMCGIQWCQHGFDCKTENRQKSECSKPLKVPFTQASIPDTIKLKLALTNSQIDFSLPGLP